MTDSDHLTTATAAPLTRQSLGTATDPTLWRLLLQLEAESVHALLLGPESVDTPVRYHRVELTETDPTRWAKAVEEAVYDNELLLTDFASVSVSVDTSAFALLPGCAASLADSVAAFMLPDLGYMPECDTCPMGATGEVSLALAADPTLLKFIRRTYVAPTLHHPLSAAANYLAHANHSGNSAATYALVTPGRLLVVAFGTDGTLQFANRYLTDPAEPADAAYYIMAATAADSTLIVGGDATLRNQLTPMLQQMATDVLPLPMSADLIRLRRMAPQAPIELLMLSLT